VICHAKRACRAPKQYGACTKPGFPTSRPRGLQISTPHAHHTCRTHPCLWGLLFKRGTYQSSSQLFLSMPPPKSFWAAEMVLADAGRPTPTPPPCLHGGWKGAPVWRTVLGEVLAIVVVRILDLICGAVFVVHVQLMAVGAGVQPMTVGSGESESSTACRRRWMRTRPSHCRTAAGQRRDSGGVKRVELDGGVEGRGRGRGACRRRHVEERQPAKENPVRSSERRTASRGGRERAERLVAVGQSDVLLPGVELMGQGGGHGRRLRVPQRG
jgi:hypothetical protein